MKIHFTPIGETRLPNWSHSTYFSSALTRSQNGRKDQSDHLVHCSSSHLSTEPFFFFSSVSCLLPVTCRQNTMAPKRVTVARWHAGTPLQGWTGFDWMMSWFRGRLRLPRSSFDVAKVKPGETYIMQMHVPIWIHLQQRLLWKLLLMTRRVPRLYSDEARCGWHNDTWPNICCGTRFSCLFSSGLLTWRAKANLAGRLTPALGEGLVARLIGNGNNWPLGSICLMGEIGNQSHCLFGSIPSNS